MHAKSGLRVVLKWKIFRPDSVIAAVMLLMRISLSNLLLLVTWSCIACFFLVRWGAEFSYDDNTNDLTGDFYSARLAIAPEEMRLLPTWNAYDANPPLSARNALQVAKEFRKTRLKESVGEHYNVVWGLNSISLCPLNKETGKWCWRVEFEAYPDMKHLSLGGPDISLSIYVLMNGKVYEPDFQRQIPWLKSKELFNND